MSIVNKISNISCNDYVLNARIDKKEIKKIKSDWFQSLSVKKSNVKKTDISQIEFFSYVNIGKKSDSSFSKEIITFFDNAGKVVEMAFKTNEILTDIKNFAYPKVGERLISSFKQKGNNSKLWITKAFEHQNLDSKGNFLSKTENFYQEKTEYVFKSITRNNRDNKSFYERDIVSISLSGRGNNISWDNLSSSDNIKIDKDDKWLIARILNPQTAIGMKYLSEELIKRNGLQDCGIKIIPNYKHLEKKTLGGWSEYGEILYNTRLASKPSYQVAKTIAHEVEHARQYTLMGRAGNKSSFYERRMPYIFKTPLSRSEKDEAAMLIEAEKLYPKIQNGKDKKYYNNLLEKLARKAGRDFEKEYTKSDNAYFFDMLFNW